MHKSRRNVEMVIWWAEVIFVGSSDNLPLSTAYSRFHWRRRRS